MKAVNAREANQGFSELLARVENGEEVLITKHGRAVAVLSPYRLPVMTAERQTALNRMMSIMKKGLPWGEALRTFSRDEMYER